MSSHESKAIKGGLFTLGSTAGAGIASSLATEDIARVTADLAHQQQSISVTTTDNGITITGPGDGTIHSQDVINHLAPATIPELILSSVLGLAATGGFFYTIYQGLKAVFGGDKDHKSAKSAAHHEKHGATSPANARKDAETVISDMGETMSGANITASTPQVNAAAAQQQPEREMVVVAAARSGNSLTQ